MTTMTTERTKHYAPAPYVLTRLPQTLARAYAVAGLPAPTIADEARALVEAEPTAREVAEAVAVASLDPNADPAEWLEDSLARIQRAQAADALRTAMNGYAEAALRRHAGRLTAEAVEALKPTFAKVAKRLTTAAEKLPADPFDLGAVIATDSTAAMKEAAAALVDLAGLASLHKPRPGSLGPEIAALASVVRFPEVPQAEHNRMTGTPDSPAHPQRDAVRVLDRDTRAHGLDRVLVDVARGQYDGVTLAYADSPADVEQNLERARIALTSRGVDTWR